MPGSSPMTSEMPGSRLEAGPASRVRDSAASVATAANGPPGAGEININVPERTFCAHLVRPNGHLGRRK